MMTGRSMVSARKCARSDFSRQGNWPARPMTPFSPTAATSTIFIIRLRAATSMCRFRLVGETLQGLPTQTTNSPLVHNLRADRCVECNGWRIPVEHGPFEACVTALDAMLRQPRKQRFADAAAAKRRPHEHVFQIEAVPPAESGKNQEPDCESHRHPVPFRDVAKRLWRPPEQGIGDLRFARIQFMRQFLV